ncbi:MAG: hypothetical protein AB7G13_11545 [Lautropia sp.]
MKLPYERATSGKAALSDIEKTLRAFGCTSFGSMMNFAEGVLLVQFEHRGRQVSVKASISGYAAAWLRANPWHDRRTGSRVDYERKAKEIGSKAVYSALRDWIKGQLTAIECGILSFEGAFLGQILMPNGRTVLEHAQTERLLPAPSPPT